MARFKIYLLTPKLTSENLVIGNTKKVSINTEFLLSLISDFETRNQVVNLKQNDSLAKWMYEENTNYTYTYNEKFSQHKNAQEELSFSMDKKILSQDQWLDNPYVSLIHNGSMLLLVDKYDNEHLFFVKNIQYKTTEFNMSYNYSCQDAFNFQLASQNEGYEIKNDINSSNFIGALTINEWAEKIRTDCHVHYNYIKSDWGLYIDSNNKVRSFTLDSNKNYVNADGSIIHAKKVIKTPLNLPEITDPFPFSIGNSNAASALIDLGKQIGLILKTYEWREDKDNDLTKMQYYFWYELEKNDRILGYKYSPKVNVQDFTFSQSGESLTTILNVNSNKVDDKIISMIPEVPEFFMKYFDTEEWDNSVFYDGFFNSLIRKKSYHIASSKLDSSEEISLEYAKANYLQIIPKEGTHFQLPALYNYITFNGLNASWVSRTEGQDLFFTYSDDQNWYFIIECDDGTEIKILNNTEIPSQFWGKAIGDTIKIAKPNANNGYDFLKIKAFYIYGLFGEVKGANGNWDINLIFYREPTDEEQEFADIADKCPWLENKIINFKYFYDLNIINKYEYGSLLLEFKDKLRKINGKLLTYSKTYYNSLKHKASLLAKINNQIENMGAECQNTIINQYARKGDINNFIPFSERYKILFSPIDNIPTITNKNDSLTEYFNKYQNAQQSFLKNIYNFTNYFNSPVSLGDNKIIHDVKITSDWGDVYKEKSRQIHKISFAGGNYKSIIGKDGNLDPYFKLLVDNKTGLIGTEIFDKNRTVVNLINANSLVSKKYYTLKQGMSANYRPVEEGTPYNNNITYFKKDKTEYVPISLAEMKKEYLKTNLTNYYYKVPLYRDISNLSDDWAGNRDTITDVFFIKTDSKYLPITYTKYGKDYYRRTKSYRSPSKINGGTYGREARYKQAFSKDVPIYRGTHKTGNGGSLNLRGTPSAKLWPGSNYTYIDIKDFDVNQTKDYENTYKHIGYTAEDLKTPDENRGAIVYKTKKLKKLTLDSNISYNNNGRYYYTIADINIEDNNDIMNFNNWTTVFFPLNLDIGCWGENTFETMTLRKFLDYDGSLSWVEDSKNNIQICILEDYELIKYETNAKYDLNEIYNEEGLKVDIQNNADFTKGYYVAGSSDVSFELATDFNIKNIYYEKLGPNQYLQKDTFYTLSDKEKYSFIGNSSYNTVTYGNTKKIWVNLVLYDLTISKSEITSITSHTYDEPLLLDFNELGSTIELELIGDNQQVYKSTFTFEAKEKAGWNTSLMSNGEFWFKVQKDQSVKDLVEIQEKAKFIETELSSYWDQSYVASKNCEYFLPEHWQISTEQANNYFNANLFFVNKVDSNYYIQINNNFIPKVLISNNDPNVTKYRYTFKKKDVYNKVITTANKVASSIDLETNKIYQNNIAVQNLFKEAKMNYKEWAIASKIPGTYYYSLNGGLKWKDLIFTLTEVNGYEKLNGNYLLMLEKINFCKEEFNKNYHQYKELQEKEWANIYNRYKGIILERVYSNNTAATSQELFTLAGYYFKDLATPERQYNITTIDYSKLHNYKNEELKIGDPIEIDANAYYEEYDDVKNMLQQFLFVSDISYTLRKDNDIQLTVNTIKYQDKLIQNLARMIKI